MHVMIENVEIDKLHDCGCYGNHLVKKVLFTKMYVFINWDGTTSMQQLGCDIQFNIHFVTYRLNLKLFSKDDFSNLGSKVSQLGGHKYQRTGVLTIQCTGMLRK